MKKLLQVLVLLISGTAFAQTWEQTERFDGSASMDHLGDQVAISDDGQTIAIGTPFAGIDNAGTIDVYIRQGDGTWNLYLTINGGAYYNTGHGLDISGNGHFLAVGQPGHDDGPNSNIGRVQVYDLRTLLQFGPNIVGEAAGDLSGRRISMSDDGNRIAIAAWSNDGGALNAGHVRIYEWSGIAWVQLGFDIDGTIAGDGFGEAISLSGNGQRLAIASHFNDASGPNAGLVTTYEFDGVYWVALGTSLFGQNSHDQFGRSVDLNADGNQMVVGATGYGPGSTGAVYTYSWNATTSDWDQRGSTIAGTIDPERFGYSVSITSDGNQIAVGSPWSNTVELPDPQGRVRVFTWVGTDWQQMDGDNDMIGHAGEEFGGRVSISDFETLIGGGPNADHVIENSGMAAVYERYIPVCDLFERYLIDTGIDTEGLEDGRILAYDALQIKELDVSSSDLSCLDGLQYFKNLVIVDISDNRLQGCLDIRLMTRLIEFRAFDNDLESIAVNDIAYAEAVFEIDEETSFATSVCGGAREGLTLNINTQLKTVVVYPNPTRGPITIESGKIKIRKVNVYDLAGMLVYASPYTDKINISGLNNGTYVVHIETGEGRTLTSRIIVEK